MPPSRITKSVVESLKPKQMVWDAEVRGFGARCQKRDRVYVLKYRASGQQRWFTIGKHGAPWTAEQARREAKRLLGLVAAGQDPGKGKAQSRSAQTMAELCDQFVDEHVSAKSKSRTAAEYRRLIERIIKPELGRRKVPEITHQEVRKLHVKHRATPYQANRTVALCSKMFSWSGRRGEANPCTGIERFAEHKRRRYLSASELKRLGEALRLAEERNLVSPFALGAIRLLLFTGARLSEVLTMRWEHVDRERSSLQLPDSKTGAKSNSPQPPGHGGAERPAPHGRQPVRDLRPARWCSSHQPSKELAGCSADGWRGRSEASRPSALFRIDRSG